MPELILVSALAAVTGLSAGFLALYGRRARSMAKAAEALGLEHDPERDALYGRRDGRRVGAGGAPVVAALEAELELRRADDQGRAAFRVAAALEPPLDLGLRVGRRGFFSYHENVFETDHDFEYHYATEADEPVRARALLDAELRARLVTVAGPWKAWLTDGGVLLEPGGRPNAEKLVELVSAADALATCLDARRRELPLPAPVEEVFDSWRRQAKALELRLGVNPVRAEGEHILARVVRAHAGSFDMLVTARLSPPLSLELRARSTRAEGLAVTSPRDVTSGDLDFDTVYDVEALDERAFRQVFDREARRALLELAASYAVSLDDAGVTVRGPLGDGEALGRMCARASQVARLLERRRGTSAYR